MNDRLQKQARGLLEEIEVGDWVVHALSPQPRKVTHMYDDVITVVLVNGLRGWAREWRWRLATPEELLDHGIIDEIPDDPRRLDLTGIAIDHLTNPRPLPQSNTILSGLIWLGLIYIIHSQNTDDGPMVHYRLTDEGREVVEMEVDDAE